jgi:hypothetical protein
MAAVNRIERHTPLTALEQSTKKKIAVANKLVAGRETRRAGGGSSKPEIEAVGDWGNRERIDPSKSDIVWLIFFRKILLSVIELKKPTS